MKVWCLIVLSAVSACTDPTLSTGLTFGTGGVSVSPTLSGRVGGGTVYIQP
jgi:hypothetical protein